MVSILILMTGLFILINNSENSAKAYQDFDVSLTESEIEDYKALSIMYCSGCHTYPEAHLLPKNIWLQQTLPNMGPIMGIDEFEGIQYPRDRSEHVPEGYYPDRPIIRDDHWEKILKFYASEAPESLSTESKEPAIITDTLFFKPHTPDYSTDEPPTATIAKFDPGNKKIYTSDIDGTNLLIFNENLELENTLFLSSTLSDIVIPGDLQTPGIRELYLTYLGSMIPSDAPEGFIVQTDYSPNPSGQSGGDINVISENLVRPVQLIKSDLNLDGFDDLLVHEFGHREGSLFWLEGTQNGYSSTRNILHDRAGCIQSYVMDYTGNNRDDILSLCTQTDQTIYLFENQGKGEFNKKPLLQFPITAGSSSFEMVDFNGDGHLDILYTSGDNADFSITFKPYHGVYIYENEGSDQYVQKWFYPVNGAYNAKARDFSGDGNLDVAVISFFGDYANQPEENFILFMNDLNTSDDYSFTPYHHPAASNGRWLRMDVADWTGNGREDILLSNYSLGPDVTEDQAKTQDKFINGPLFLLLENISEKE